MTAQHSRYRGAREVVLGRTETAAEDYHAGTPKGVSEYLGDIFFSVAHNGLKADFEPRFIQFLRKEQRIGVLEVRRQQLGSDCDNLGFHIKSASAPGPWICAPTKKKPATNYTNCLLNGKDFRANSYYYALNSCSFNTILEPQMNTDERRSVFICVHLWF